MQAQLESIPDGNAGLSTKLQRMRQLVEMGRRDPDVRATAAAIVQHLPERAYAQEIAAVHQAVRDRVRYLMDPVEVETFQEPGLTLGAMPYGDCDDHVVLLGALLESIGYPTRFTVGGDAGDEQWSHVWLEVHQPGGRWKALDPIAKSRGLGFDPQGYFPSTRREPVTRGRTRQYGGACALSGEDLGLGDDLGRNFFHSVERTVLRPVGHAFSVAGNAVGQQAQRTVIQAAPVIRAVSTVAAPVLAVTGVGLPLAAAVAAVGYGVGAAGQSLAQRRAGGGDAGASPGATTGPGNEVAFADPMVPAGYQVDPATGNLVAVNPASTQFQDSSSDVLPWQFEQPSWQAQPEPLTSTLPAPQAIKRMASSPWVIGAAAVVVLGGAFLLLRRRRRRGRR